MQSPTFISCRIPATMASQLIVEQRSPKLFKTDKSNDRQHGTRTVPMEVINLGFPRTGTMCTYLPFVFSCHSFDDNPSVLLAMQTALNIVGFTCYHSINFFPNIKQCTAWNVAMDAKCFDKRDPFTIMGRSFRQLQRRLGRSTSHRICRKASEDLSQGGSYFGRTRH